MSVLHNLDEFRGLIKSHIGSDLNEKPEPLLSSVLGHFDSILSNGGDKDNTIEATKRNGSTNWGLFLQDTIGFLQSHKGLIQDVESQSLRIDEDIKILLNVIQSQVAKEGINDNEYLVSLPQSRKQKGQFSDKKSKFRWNVLSSSLSPYPMARWHNQSSRGLWSRISGIACCIRHCRIWATATNIAPLTDRIM